MAGERCQCILALDRCDECPAPGSSGGGSILCRDGWLPPLADTVIIDATDDEWWPQSDEKVHRSFTVDMVLDENQPANWIEIPHVR